MSWWITAQKSCLRNAVFKRDLSVLITHEGWSLLPVYWHYQATFERNLKVLFNNSWWVKFSLSGGNKDNIRAGCKKCGYRKSVISNMKLQSFLQLVTLVGTAFWGEGKKRKQIFSLLVQKIVSLNHDIIFSFI